MIPLTIRGMGEAMNIRIDVQMDHGEASMRYIATATLDGKHLYEVGEYGGLEAPGKVFTKVAEWLEGQGYPVPDHYWQQTFPH